MSPIYFRAVPNHGQDLFVNNRAADSEDNSEAPLWIVCARRSGVHDKMKGFSRQPLWMTDSLIGVTLANLSRGGRELMWHRLRAAQSILADYTIGTIIVMAHLATAEVQAWRAARGDPKRARLDLHR
jgi:hypothetical protein